MRHCVMLLSGCLLHGCRGVAPTPGGAVHYSGSPRISYKGNRVNIRWSSIGDKVFTHFACDIALDGFGLCMLAVAGACYKTPRNSATSLVTNMLYGETSSGILAKLHNANPELL